MIGENIYGMDNVQGVFGTVLFLHPGGICPGGICPGGICLGVIAWRYIS